MMIELSRVDQSDGDAVFDRVPAWRRGISAAELMTKSFGPIKWAVDSLLVEGLTLLGGKPKVGKSWLALDFAVAVANGEPALSKIPVESGDVLYLALEDNQRRLKRRLQSKGISRPPGRLTLATEWPSLDDGCITELEAWASSVERPRLIIIDVLKMIRGRSLSNEQLYDSDYRALTGLAAFARRRALAVLVLHHVRKMEAEDPLESLSGTNGLTGAADTVMVLRSDNRTGGAVVYVRGRDVEEAEKAVRFNRSNCTWCLIGDAAEVGRTSERQAILNVLREAGKPLDAREIADRLGAGVDATRRSLNRMSNAGEIAKPARGSFTLSQRSESPNKPNQTVGQTGQG